jgi:F420H(2)-dependent quinone reductase
MMSGLWFPAMHIHRWIYEHSGGLLAHRVMFGHPTLLLRITGRRSGLSRTTALSYSRDGATYLIVAANGGSPKSPAWYGNLQANPDCEIQVGRRGIRVIAHVTLPGDPDFERRWDIVDANYKGLYTKDQRKTQRPIPIVQLRPPTPRRAGAHMPNFKHRKSTVF